MDILIKFYILFTLKIFSKCCENCNENYIKRVNYFENLINKEINESMYYNSPNSAEEYKPNTNQVHDYGWVHFIIAGAGPTGSVIANRLSEINNWKILVLEAGESPTEFSEIPGVHLYLGNSKFNWNYKTVPQTNSCLGLKDQRCRVTRGKVIGGSSGINGLVYARGNKEDFNRWTLQGNKGWSFDDVLPYYIKSENSQVDGDPNYHGKGGYWNVKSMKSCNPQFVALIEAHKQLFNCSLNNDYNGEHQLGISPLQFNVIRNKRDSVGSAFLNPVENRKNLEVLEKAFVTKVLINNRLKLAQGVEFTYKGKLYHVWSKKEVILSTGAISSPKILMLSGIGPKEELAKHDIPVVKNLPVGKNLIEPPGYTTLFVQTNYSAPKKTIRKSVEEYLSYSGIYEVPGNSEGIGYYQSSYTKVDDYPDIEIKYMGSPTGGSDVQQNLPITDETFNALWSKFDPQSTFNVYLTVLQPKSIGSVKLASKNPYEYPLIDLNILGDPQDMEVLYQALQILQNLLDTPAMKAINASIVYGDFPQCRMYSTGSKDYWNCVFKLLTASSFASTSTCRMGPNQSTSVVNDKLQVHGIQNLRVADLSVFPDPVSAPPTATAVMIDIMTIIKMEEQVPECNSVNEKLKPEKDLTGEVAIDEQSIKGQFGWDLLNDHHIPYIFRHGEKYISTAMIESKCLTTFLSRIHPVIYYYCTQINSYKTTETEEKLLNEINCFHSDFYFHKTIKTRYEHLILLEDAKQFSEFLNVAIAVLYTPECAATTKCGYFLINRSYVSFVVINDEKYVPLLYFNDIQQNLLDSIVVKGWDKSYLNLCFAIQKLRQEIIAEKEIVCVRFESIASRLPPNTRYEPVLLTDVAHCKPTQERKVGKYMNWFIKPISEI